MVVVGDGEVALKGFCLKMYPVKVYPVGIWCENDVGSMSMRHHHVASTLIRRMPAGYRGRVDEFGCQVLSLRQ